MKISKKICLALLLVPLFVLSCKYELVGETTPDFNEKKNAADYNDFILPPTGLKASNGLSNCVELEWDIVPNAVQYQIFSAETPYDTFKKVSETKDDSVKITVDEEPGITKYYSVCAVNYYGTVSSKSIVVSGSSLAVPVITEIVPSEEGSSVSVHWWLDNCSDTTYEDQVYFNISVYSKYGSGIKLKTVTIEGTERSAVIGGLSSNTDYDFEVEICRKDGASKESSGKTNAETAHRVVPDAPEEFTVSQGVSKDNIELFWKAPEGVWYREKSGTSGFVLHPVYFQVFRKEGDGEFEEIATLGLKPASWTYKQSMPDGFIEITMSGTGNPLASPYSAYIPGAVINYTDTTAERGKQYIYYVQSVTDDTPQGKLITSETSRTQEEAGWRLSVPLFSIDDEDAYEENGNKFTKITFKYQAVFETFGKSYKYFVKRNRYTLTSDENEPAIATQYFPFNSLDEINAGTDIFDFSDGAAATVTALEGYYDYTLYVCPYESSDYNSYIDIFPASGRYVVTDDATKVPYIEHFIVDDGYSNKYVLKWSYDPLYTYTVIWQEVEGENVGIKKLKTLVKGTDFSTTTDGNGYVTYEHPAESGSRRIYTLQASTGIKAQKKPDGTVNTDLVFETLGIPDLKFTEYDYDKITVTWKKVQKADNNYEVTATFTDDNSNALSKAAEISITDGLCTCVIDKPVGYNSAQKSGKKIALTVKAKNGNKASTSATKNVCTLGPALSNVSLTTVQTDKIIIKWNKIEGAAGYLIYRNRYKDGTAAALASEAPLTKYYWDGTDITVDANPVLYAKIKDEGNGVLSLTDNVADFAAPEDAYEINQSALAWGLPFGYCVVPVKADSELTDVPQYTDLNKLERITSTTGFGFNVHAEKSQNGEKQVITWNQPYYRANDTYPSVYYRPSGSSSKEWTKLPAQATGTRVEVTPLSKTGIYEYCIVYKRNDGTVIMPDSFVNDQTLGLSAMDTVYDYTDKIPEKANKGYLLAVEASAAQLNAEKGDDYSEVISWLPWNFAERSIGPDYAYISILNYNLSDQWTKVCTLDENLYYNSVSTELENTDCSSPDQVSIVLRPHTFMDGSASNPVTKGQLQVLRDPMHYYSMTLVKVVNAQNVLSDICKDESVYAYRDITEKELVKCAMLSLAYGFYKEAGGKDNLSNVGERFKYKDKQKFQEGNNVVAEFGNGDYDWGNAGKYLAKVSMYSYNPKMLNPGGTETSVVKVSMKDVTVNIKGLSDYYPFKFGDNKFTLTVDKVYDFLPDSYSGTFQIICSNSTTLKIYRSGESNPFITASSNEERKRYFPMQIYDDKQYWIKDSGYGWWELKKDE